MGDFTPLHTQHNYFRNKKGEQKYERFEKSKWKNLNVLQEYFLKSLHILKGHHGKLY